MSFRVQNTSEFADSVLPLVTVIFVQDSKSGYEDIGREKALTILDTLKVHSVLREATSGGYKLTFLDSSATNCSQIKNKIYEASDLNGNNIPLKQGDFVITTYEGEKFPARRDSNGIYGSITDHCQVYDKR